MKPPVLSLWLLVCPFWLFCQQAILTSGGTETNQAGTISYSIGQIQVDYWTSNEITIQEGVQQTYIISEIQLPKGPTVIVNAKIYPNPTTDILYLEIIDSELDGLSYQVTDILGRELSAKAISVNTSEISMQLYEQAVYLVQVLKYGQPLVAYRVIKR